MSEERTRPILRLKFPPATPPAAPVTPGARTVEAKASPLKPVKVGGPAKAGGPVWRCKPCGAEVILPLTAEEGDVVRCPACNANLGKAVHFLSDPPLAGKLRARRGS